MTDQLLNDYQHVISDMKLIPGSGGVFEVVVDDNLIFSKKGLKRHAEEGEIVKIFEGIVGPDVPKFHDQG